jgi:hypothetical protein
MRAISRFGCILAYKLGLMNEDKLRAKMERHMIDLFGGFTHFLVRSNDDEQREGFTLVLFDRKTVEFTLYKTELRIEYRFLEGSPDALILTSMKVDGSYKQIPEMNIYLMCTDKFYLTKKIEVAGEETQDFILLYTSTLLNHLGEQKSR